MLFDALKALLIGIIITVIVGIILGPTTSTLIIGLLSIFAIFMITNRK